jgi:beta-lactamase superfamily II metal-dependent hydrolase
LPQGLLPQETVLKEDKEGIMLKLHIVQAKQGDCMILEYGMRAKPKYILIDGGPATIYKTHLRGELRKIKKAKGKLDLVVLSHVDDDHVRGLLDLMAELQQQRDDGIPETISIDTLWHNSYSQTMGDEIEARFRQLMEVEDAGPLGAIMATSDTTDRNISQGDRLTEAAAALGIEINPFTLERPICVDDALAPITFDNLHLHVVGPTDKNLEELRKDWLAWLKAQEKRAQDRDLAMVEEAAIEADESVPNLSSIMLLAEAEGKTILLTGDGLGDDLLQGLGQAGLLNPDGKLHVDLLKLPHHGSARNVTKEFFKTVTADKYVISANGNNGNPDLVTLTWIVEAAKEQARQIEIVATNTTDSLRQLVKAYTPNKYGYRLIKMQPKAHALTLELASDTAPTN